MEEIKKSINAVECEIEKQTDVLNSLNNQRKQLYRQLCDKLKEKYAEYIGKRVVITFQKQYYTPKSVEGYLNGFEVYDTYGIEIRPSLSKIKKDGSKSLNTVPLWDSENYENIMAIKLVKNVD